jgi:hypothetical protein
MKGYNFWDKKPYSHAGFLLGLFLNPEDGGYMFLRNIGCFSTDYISEEITLQADSCLVGQVTPPFMKPKGFTTVFTKARHRPFSSTR